MASLLCIAIVSLFFYSYNYISNKKFISKKEAGEIAEWRFKKSIQEDDPVFKSWEQSTLGDPILVRTLEEEPSYWIVPVIFQEKVIGFIVIEGDGKIPRYGVFGCGKPDNLSACPSVITFITTEEAIILAKNITAKYPDAKISAPIFVHEEEKSKTAWMLKLEKKGKIISRVFVAGSYVYERVPGEKSKYVAGLYIAFEENITENEIRSILDNYNLILHYELKFNYTSIHPLYYIVIHENDFETIEGNLKEKQIFLQKTSKKRNGQIIVTVDNFHLSENELIPIMDSYNLPLKRITWIIIIYKDSGISKDDGDTLKENLEKNEKVIVAHLFTRKG